MDKFEKICDLADSNLVELSADLKKELGKRLVLGHTRHMIRYGILSDGCEHITDAQRYYQCYREQYSRAQSIKLEKVQAMKAQADLLDSKQEKKDATTPQDNLRADANYLDAETKLLNCLVGIEDKMRELDELNKIRCELEPIVEKKYPVRSQQLAITQQYNSKYLYNSYYPLV